MGVAGTAAIAVVSYASFSKSQEVKDGSSNLVVTSEGMIYSFKVQLHNSAWTNAGGGQRIYAIFYNATNGVNHANTKYTYIHCNQTWDNVTMDYSIKGIGAETQNRVIIARTNPYATFDLADVASTLASDTHNTSGAVWQITTPVTIGIYDPETPSTYTNSYHEADDVYRVYWANEESSQTYYHLEMNPQGTANHDAPAS